MNIRPFIATVLVMISMGCEPEIDSFRPDSGDADFSVYVSIGSSFTAGFSDNELYKSAQMVSYPNIISRQLSRLGINQFKQPLIQDEIGFGNRVVLEKKECAGDSVLLSAPMEGIPDAATNSMNIFEEEGPFHNMGVHGARVFHLNKPLNSTSSSFFNHYNRFASTPEATILQDAMALHPTFFSLWIGTTDIFNFAINPTGNDSITDPEIFSNYLDLILTELTQSTSQGCIANIPQLTNIPFFTTIEPTPLWVEDPDASEGKRPLTADEKVLLPALDLIHCQGWGEKELPLPKSYILTSQQVQLIDNAIAAYNNIIEQKAVKYNLALVDLRQLLQNAHEGLVYDGIRFSTDYISGGIFSVDGIYLSPRGNAIVANHFIEAINQKYGSSVPKVSVTQYRGIIFP